MRITSFASSRPLERAELLGAPIRYPRPERLSAALRVGGPRATEAASSLGLHTVGNLLEHLPHDRREARSVAQLTPGESATVVVEVRAIASRPVRRRGMRPLVEATVADGSGSVKATFFNQPWLVQKYAPGARIVLHGKLEGRNRFRVQAHAPTTDAAASGEGVAHYPATEGISSTQIHALVREHAAGLADVVEPLPGLLLAAEALPNRSAALAAVHFPELASDQPGGRSRLAFDELLLVQLALLRRRARRDESAAAPVLARPRELTARWLEHLLPFALTADQDWALTVIDSDLEQARPMQRLLMGEVGSGKTVVALRAMLQVVDAGGQAALLAPT